MRFPRLLFILVTLILAFSCESDSEYSLSGTGQAGSMSRFAISDNHLYLVDSASLKIFSIADGAFRQVEQVWIDFGMETIFATPEYLYLGANDAMYIFSLADPAKPSFVFRYEHILACDPVVVQGNRAYISIRSGNGCNRGQDALQIIDITDPYAPVLVKNYLMRSPRGLAVDSNLLFLCEGEMGLKVFDITNEEAITMLESRDDFFAYDVIAREGIATITGSDGIYQFSYGNMQEKLSLLSKIAVTADE
jgi:hypothetical protein